MANGKPMIVFNHIYDNEKRIIILCSEYLLETLCQYEMICAGGTFSIAPKRFK